MMKKNTTILFVFISGPTLAQDRINFVLKK
jgi:hypothetical protein